MTQLATLPAVKALLRVDFCDDDALLDMLISAASEAVLDYLKPQGYSSFYDGSSLIGDVPFKVQLAVAHLVKYYFDFDDEIRGDAFSFYGTLPPAVVGLLYRMRDPAFC